MATAKVANPQIETETHKAALLEFKQVRQPSRSRETPTPKLVRPSSAAVMRGSTAKLGQTSCSLLGAD